MKHLFHILFVLACTANCLFAQVTLSVTSATVRVGDTFNIDVSIAGFDSLSSAQFRLKWDPSIIRLEEVDMPVDTLTGRSPFTNNFDPNRITFLYDNLNGVGDDGSLRDGTILLNLRFVAVGNSPDSTCIMIDPSGAFEFIKLASEELSRTIQVGCVHLQGVNSLSSHEQNKINCYWQSNDRLHVSHSPSANSATIQVFTLDGRLLNDITVAPNTTTSNILVSQEWQRSILAVRYSQNGLSYTSLIPGPR